ncbi:MAG: ABC transporter ATP-binding protein [Demequina sp.]|uniref:energy-coupling factor ABC transporter ATP-binding protein n=1 Tax=Demequina sp. TaxID=2050685 RepID=UPI001999B97D|nr:ABC transporter ATP-binding protein [Demequina sp.]MBC7297302.1 ABC transporter ATP-binding protein [Demequina sp.]
MIEFKDATVVAPDSGITILKPTTLSLSERRITIIGANGSGKSTLARLINGLSIPVSGTVSVDGVDTVKHGALVRRKVGFLFTDPTSQLIMPTAIEDVMLSLRRVVRSKNERIKAALAALEDIGLGDKAEVSVNALSGGQRQLLALAGVLTAKPQVVVADEPTTLLDLRWKAHVGALLHSLPIQLIEVTHDLEAATKAQRTLVVDDGGVVFDGDPVDAVAHYRDLMYRKSVGESS